MCHRCKRICLRQYNGTCSVPPREQMYSLSVFLHDWRKKNHPFMTKQLPAGWTCFKKIICIFNRMHWKRIDNSSAGAYGLCLQWGQCWCEFRSCKGHCQPQSSKTCSVQPEEQMYLLSVFFTCWRKNNHILMTQQADRLNGFLKEAPTADQTLRNALTVHFQIFSKGLYNIKTDILIYRNYCEMNTSHLHMPWVNVKGSTCVQNHRTASSSW